MYKNKHMYEWLKLVGILSCDVALGAKSYQIDIV